jgi:photosystem II stability/assembly factor-like uncharacterized protein
MRTVSRWSLLGLIPLLMSAGISCIVGDACAQWTNVAPNLVPGAPFIGAMQFKDGIVWAGAYSLWYSPDTGKTWKQSANFPSANIADIAFYDKLHGLVATEDQGLFITIDGGSTWTQELSTGNLVKVGYNRSSSNLIALDIDGPIHFSMDGGNTWSGSPLYNGTFHSFAIAQDGTIYVDGDSTNSSPGSVLVSNDFGNTWNVTSGTFNGDSWTLAVDSCNTKLLYLANEDNEVPDSISNFYLSTDGGQSWQITDTKAKPYFSGTLSTTADGIFLGTEDGSGIHRSMDRGMTWTAIGGPVIFSDTRNIALITDNIILAADDHGSIWRTTNGGGDSVQSAATGGLALTPAQLFTTDTLECTSVARSIQIVRGCAAPSLDSVYLAGPDSASYHIDGVGNDSITLTLMPQTAGTQSAWLVGKLDNGTNDTVFLSGVGIASHALTMTTSSAIRVLDTIGGEVSVPITINGLAHAENVEMVLNYPLPDLQYVGSFDPSGTQVDVPGQQWPGRSLLSIMNVEPGQVAANACFNVFSDTDYNPIVTFDSLVITTATSSCEYAPPPAVSTTIYPVEGCAIQMLSQWFHLGVTPLFSIIPNPTGGIIQLTTTVTLGAVWVNVYDVLGTKRGQFSVSFQKNIPTTLTLPFENGLYLLRIVSPEGEAHATVIISK